MDSANRTFIIMLILTFVFFFFTTMRIFKPNETSQSNENQFNEIKNNEQSSTITRVPSNIFTVVNSDSQSETNVLYENNKIKIEFSRKNADIINAWIKHSETEMYPILLSNGEAAGMTLKFGSWNNGKTIEQLVSNPSYNLEIENNLYSFKITLLDAETKTELTIEKHYQFYDDEYIFKLDTIVSNNGKQVYQFDNSNKALSFGWGPTLGVISDVNNKRNPRYDFYGYYSNEKLLKVDEKNKIFKQSGSLYAELPPKAVNDNWVVANSHYFAAVLMPLDNGNYNYFFDYNKIKNNQSYMGVSKTTDNTHIKSSFAIYLGPKLASELKKYEDFSHKGLTLTKTGIRALDKKIIFGLGNVIGNFLKFINRFIGNFGLSIVILTLIIKLLLAPLTHKSMLSQQKMQKLQPKMQELQTKYKEKPEMLNKKTMELYQKEGINPMSGCLPLLLQMPILFAMYQLLDRMVELKGESFLWIKDLAMPDNLIPLNFTIPILNSSSINLLPILMVLTQIATSLFTPDLQNNKQAKMMMWMMPLFFFFFFYNVSSALVLYWTTMNILGIAQQAYIMYAGKKNLLKK